MPTTIKESSSSTYGSHKNGNKFYSTNKSSGGFKVDVNKVFRQESAKKELQKFNTLPFVKEIRSK